jgi:hypothetical protein
MPDESSSKRQSWQASGGMADFWKAQIVSFVGVVGEVGISSSCVCVCHAYESWQLKDLDPQSPQPARSCNCKYQGLGM